MASEQVELLEKLRRIIEEPDALRALTESKLLREALIGQIDWVIGREETWTNIKKES